VATSNRAPEALYKDGLNREAAFEPFVSLLRTHCRVHELDGGGVDYRYAAAAAAATAAAAAAAVPASAAAALAAPHAPSSTPSLSALPRFLSPAGGAGAARALLAQLRAAGWAAPAGAEASPAALAAALAALPRVRAPLAMGRELLVREAAEGVGVASFAELCARPAGAADFLGLAARFPRALFLLDVPRLGPRQHNESRRLVTLVDVLYEARFRNAGSAGASSGVGGAAGGAAAATLVVTSATPLRSLFDRLLRLRTRGSREDAGGGGAGAGAGAARREPGMKFADFASSTAEGEAAEAEDDGEDLEDEDGGGIADDAEDDAARDARALPIAGGSCVFEARGASASASAGQAPAPALAPAPVPAQARRPRRAVVSVVTSAAERAALGELAFMCRRAASRLHEMCGGDAEVVEGAEDGGAGAGGHAKHGQQ
jgi:hypothetical protein